MATTPRRAAKAPPHAFEPRGLEGEVALPVGDRGVEQCDVRGVGGQQADRSVGGVYLAVAGVVGHRGPGQRSSGDGGKTAGRRLETLQKGEERPVLHLDLAGQVSIGKVGIGGEAREDITRVAGDHLVHQATAEEEGSEAGQTEHDQGEVRIPSPPVADQVAGGGCPPGVVGDDVE